MFSRVVRPLSKNIKAFKVHKKFLTNSLRYASTVKQSELKPEIKNVLKEDVLKMIATKADELLVRKLNFLGRDVVCRLNCASQAQLKSLGEDNCFRVLTRDLKDCWDYYWNEICKNGNDPEKWLASLKEVEDLPFVADKCYRSLQVNGVTPTPEHVAVVVKSYSKYGDYFLSHTVWGDIDRQNYRHTESSKDPIEPHVLMSWVNSRQYAFTKEYYKMLEGKVNISSDIKAKYEEVSSTDTSDVESYYTTFGASKTNGIVAREEFINQIEDSVSNEEIVLKYLQPPKEKLYNVADNQ